MGRFKSTPHDAVISRSESGASGGSGAGPRRRGAVLIAVMLILIVLAGLALVYGRAMRVEATASANRLASAQARAIAYGAAEAVLALGEELPADAVEVGGGGFWLLRPNFEDERTYAFGIVNESSKLDLNTAPAQMLRRLPGMSAEMAAAILDWRDADGEVAPDGAESEHYLRLPDPYRAKDGELESVEELMLVRGIGALELYGEDLNRNGVLDPNEDDGADSEPPDNRDGRLDRGLIDFVTVYSAESDESADGQRRINVNGSGGGGPPGRGAGGGGGADALRDVLAEALGAERGAAVWANILGGRPHRNPIDLYYKSGMSIEEFGLVAERLTTSNGPRRGLIDVNTAPREVLLTLGELEEGDVDALIGYRSGVRSGVGSAVGGGAEPDGGPLASVAWVTEVLEREKAIAIGGLITTGGVRRSVDIVAVSGDGRAFERYRMVYEASGKAPQVLYWRRLTHLGWPLDPEVLRAIRAGTPIGELVRTTDRRAF